ncbi:MAG: CAP domain-containing protein [Dehalococcoidia bacterium]
MARWLVWLGAALIVAGTLVPRPSVPARAAGDCSIGDAAVDEQERAFLVLINDYRAGRGLRALSLAPSLNRSAAWLAKDMADRGYFSHTDLLGRDPSKRAGDCGYPGPAGENNAAGTFWSDAQHVFEAWKASPGHNENMLNSSYVAIGIGRAYNASSAYGWYWVTDFGFDLEAGSPKPPPPTPTPALPTPAPQPQPQPNVVLYAGANLVTWVGNTVPAATGLQPAAASVTAVYSYEAATGTWSRFGPALPSYVNSIQTLERGRAYWMLATNQAVLKP